MNDLDVNTESSSYCTTCRLYQFKGEFIREDGRVLNSVQQDALDTLQDVQRQVEEATKNLVDEVKEAADKAGRQKGKCKSNLCSQLCYEVNNLLLTRSSNIEKMF